MENKSSFHGLQYTVMLYTYIIIIDIIVTDLAVLHNNTIELGYIIIIIKASYILLHIICQARPIILSIDHAQGSVDP